jgi:drug/metabolite transporter (DMT)-like permease
MFGVDERNTCSYFRPWTRPPKSSRYDSRSTSNSFRSHMEWAPRAMGSQMLTLFDYGPSRFWLLASGGLVTAVPLLFFGAAARRLPRTTICLLQYTTPLVQFTTAITVLEERLSAERWIGFGFGVVWLALLVLSADTVHAARRRRFLCLA